MDYIKLNKLSVSLIGTEIEWAQDVFQSQDFIFHVHIQVQSRTAARMKTFSPAKCCSLVKHESLYERATKTYHHS
jgi:hypothetical protein